MSTNMIRMENCSRLSDKDGSGHVDGDDIEFSGYLEGDGDFRSREVKALRDEADIIITNLPKSLIC